MSLAVHAKAAPVEIVWFCTVTLVVVVAVCTVRAFAVFAAKAVRFATLQIHPVVAVGIVITPADADPPVPTFTVNAAVPLDVATEGVDPKPEAIVGAVADTATTPPICTDPVAFKIGVTTEVPKYPVLGRVAPLAPMSTVLSVNNRCVVDRILEGVQSKSRAPFTDSPMLFAPIRYRPESVSDANDTAGNAAVPSGIKFDAVIAGLGTLLM